MVRIGVDFDGTLTRIRLNGSELSGKLCGVLFFLGLPNRKLMKALRYIQKEGHEIIIVSARPKCLMRFSKKWLSCKKLNYTEMIFNGVVFQKENKLRVIKEKKIDLFVDDDRKIRGFLEENLIPVISPKEFVNFFYKK